MGTFIQQLINGLMQGSVYSLVAIGYSLVLGVLDLLNFAHGDIFMFGTFIGLLLALSLGQPAWVDLMGIMAGAAMLGFLLELFCFRPAKKPEYRVAPILSSVAFGILLSNLVIIIWGSEPRLFPALVKIPDFHIGSLIISSVQVVILGVALMMMVALHLFIQKTRFGGAMRAVSEDPEVAKLLGVNTQSIIVYTFMLSSALAGAAGFLMTLRLGTVSPDVGLPMGIKALAVMVIGGMGNVTGAMVGGLIMGLAETMAMAYGSATYAPAVIWGTLIVIILFKPSGLFGLRLRRVER